jgi:hypothetical protein
MDNGFYWVRPETDEPWEVALFQDDAWWFHGIEHGAEQVDEIGPQLAPPVES